MTSDEIFMQRALDLAQLGIGNVSPNPRVGCVVVRSDKIIGEGWHKQFGEAHAEVNAIDSIKDKSILKDCTVYVNLEPCAHIGKTPPCADLLVSHQVKRVVIGNIDPNPMVAGKGIAILKKSGIEVTMDVLGKAGLDLNKRFFTFINKKRPYVILKWAQTSDGFIARSNLDSKWISNKYSRQLVHKWRSEEDAILVGYQTALHDNPELSVRDWTGKSPVRIVIDKNLQLDPSLHLFDRSIKTICYNLIRNEEQIHNLSFVKLKAEDIALQLLEDLHSRDIQSVLIEGGAKTLNQFLERGLWDEARVFKSEQKFEEGIPAPILSIKPSYSEGIEGDELCVYFNNIKI